VEHLRVSTSKSSSSSVFGSSTACKQLNGIPCWRMQLWILCLDDFCRREYFSPQQPYACSVGLGYVGYRKERAGSGFLSIAKCGDATSPRAKRRRNSLRADARLKATTVQHINLAIPHYHQMLLPGRWLGSGQLTKSCQVCHGLKKQMMWRQLCDLVMDESLMEKSKRLKFGANKK
jgi:hypothetical protein